MNENELQQTLEKFNSELPHFPDGRIDYSDAETALVVGIIVLRGDKLMLVKRSQNVSFYPSKWNWVSGFIDEVKPLREFVEQELQEETGITHPQIKDIVSVQRVTIVDKELGKTWLIYPVIAELGVGAEPELDWEADEYAWVEPPGVNSYDTVPGVAENITAALKQYNHHD